MEILNRLKAKDEVGYQWRVCIVRYFLLQNHRILEEGIERYHYQLS